MKKFRWLQYALPMLSFIFYSSLMAQGTWKVFTKDDGLTSNKISQIFNDSNANLWFICAFINIDMEPEPLFSKGVIKFDGQNWTNYYDKHKLAIVNVIFEDSRGTIWLGTHIPGGLIGNGLTRIVNSSFEMVSKVGVKFIVEDSKGTIWFGGKKFGSYDGKSVTEYSKKEFGAKNITALHCDKSDKIWVGTKKGVSFFDGNNWNIISNVPYCPTKTVYSIISDTNGNIWIGAEDGVFKYDGNNWQNFTVADGLMGDATKAIILDTKNNIYAISGKPESLVSRLKVALADKGFSIYNNGKWIAFSDMNGAPSNLKLKYFEDRSGNLWFNMPDKTIYKFDGVTWTVFNESDGFRASWFSTMIEDSKGNHWFALNNGLGKFDGQNWSYFTKDSGLPSNSITSIVEDNDGNIWFGTKKGIVKYTPN